MCKKLILWCSPGFGIVDMWLPVVRKLKERGNITIDFVFPEPSSLRLEATDSDLFNLAEQFADRVIYRGYSGRWFVAHTLIEASSGIKFSNFDEKISQLSKRLLYGRASKFFILRIIGKYLKAILKYIAYLKEDFSSQSHYDISLIKNVDGVLCDFTVEKKVVNKELIHELNGIQKFSMMHGPCAHWVMNRMSCVKSVNNRSDITVYSMSHLEHNGYKKCYGVLEENIVHTGIPRHDKDWIEFVCNQPVVVKDKVFDSFVLLIGRPASAYNTVERKKKALTDIYNIICIKHKLKLVIKPHPKESIDGIDGGIYSDALGLENYGKHWMYSNKHTFILGKKSIFAISFYSGVPLDLLALNKPTIEYLDLNGLPLYDNSDSLRDEQGVPVFSTRYTKLVLGSSNRTELELHVNSILREYKAITAPLYSRYKEYFSPFDESSKIAANDIYKRVLNY